MIFGLSFNICLIISVEEISQQIIFLHLEMYEWFKFWKLYELVPLLEVALTTIVSFAPKSNNISDRWDPTNPSAPANKAILPVNEFGNKSITFIINFLFGKNITDSQSEFKCFVADKLKEINLETNRFEIETELLIKSFRKNFKIKEVPVHRYERKHGKSKLFDVPFGRFLFGLKVLRTIITGYFIWR